MSRGQQVLDFAARQGLPLLSIAELADYRAHQRGHQRAA
jgi:3,4-dihydroxy-2-butanone 4-phosphate synthase